MTLPPDAPSAPEDAGQPSSPVPGPAKEPYDPNQHMDRVRAQLAYSMLALVAALAALGLLAWRVAWDSGKSGEVERLLSVLFTPIVTIFATVIGFYFGERSARR